MRRVMLALGAFVVLVTAPVGSSAAADDATESRFLDQLARREYAARHWDRALDAFLAAHRAAPNPRLLYNIALCAELSRRPSMAFAYFDAYLESGDADPARVGDATTRRARLAQTLAIVHVTSDPPGAAFFADRRDLGVLGVTPRTIALTPGEHQLLFAREGHQDAVLTVRAVAGQAAEATATLAPITTALVLEVRPDGATIVAQGPRGEVTVPAGASSLAVGPYAVTVRAPGHREARFEMVLRQGVEERRAIALEPLPAPTGRLLVSLATGGVTARVRIDGAEMAETPARLDLSLGEHHVELTAPGYLAWTGTVRIEEGRAQHLTIDLVSSR